MTDAGAAVARYVAMLMDHPSFADAACWTVVPGSVADDALFGALSHSPVHKLDPVNLRQAIEVAETAERDGSSSWAWVIFGGDWTALLEFNGFAGSTPATLKALAAVTSPVISMYWNDAIARHRLAFAKPDRLQSTAELDDIDEADLADIPDLAPSVRAALAVESGNERAVGLAVVEMMTGAKLDERVLASQWPMIQFTVRTAERAPLERVLKSNSELERHDPELFDALDAASPSARLAARTELVDHVLRVTALDAEPIAVSLAETLAHDEYPESYPPALYELNDTLASRFTVLKHGFSDTAAWQRSRAVGMLFGFLNPRDGHLTYRRRYGGWFQAFLALGENGWPIARAAALNRLRE